MINLIVAISKNGVIGKSNSLPWYYKEDLQYFKEITTGKTVVMGKNTFNSILSRNNKPLPNRNNVVVTRNVNYSYEGVVVINDVKKYLLDNKDKDIFVIGGKQIYEEVYDLVDRFYITHINKDYDGDIVLNIDYSKLELSKSFDKNELTFAVYERRK